MAGLLTGDPSHRETSEGNFKISQERPEEGGGHWYFSRNEIEENCPSRQDGIDLKKETYLRKSYCTFLQDLGMRLKVPQTIATVCMFLAGKVEETPRPLKDVILVSYEIIHKKDTTAMQKIKQKEVYEQQKELILQGERVVLATLGFDLNLQHPYKPLVEAIKKFQVVQNALAQVAWNFVNDGLRTSLCLQFKPHHIAAGAIFLAAKFLKVKLPSDGEKVWWQEFDVTPRQLEEVSNQMLELYEQNRLPPTPASEAEGSAGGSQRPPSKGPDNEENLASYSSSHGVGISKAVSAKPTQTKPIPDQQHSDNYGGPSRTSQTSSSDYGRSEITNISDHKREENQETQNHETEATLQPVNSEEVTNKTRFVVENHDGDGNSASTEMRNNVESKDKYHGRNVSSKDATVSQSQDAIKKLNREKVRAALERRKARGDITHMSDSMDELERELEDVELPGESEKIKHERKKQSWSKTSNRIDHENSHHTKYPNEIGDGHYQSTAGQSLHGGDFDYVEEGEVETFDDSDRGYHSPRSSIRKRKANSPLEKPTDADRASGSHMHNHQAYAEDRNGLGRHGYSERSHKKHLQENLV